jgi:dTDP-4-amino-4,6-dideoxygalactose transaminase
MPFNYIIIFQEIEMDKLAINGGTPVRNIGWPTWPVSDGLEEKGLLEVLHSGNWWRHSYGQGVELEEDETQLRSTVAQFQHLFANDRGCDYGICAANGTVTLEMALRAAGIRPGDEVIVPPYTYYATASAVLMVGAVPIFADIDPDTYNVNPARIEEAISDRTRAIIPVHFGGQPCDMDAIMAIAKKHDLVVIEDAAHAHASSYNGKQVGSIGNMASFSFQNSKPMTAGEGGIITTNRKDYAESIESLVWAGRKKGQPWYKHFVLASNYRMTEFQGAILIAQLSRLHLQTAQRIGNARYLDSLLNGIDGISPLAYMLETTKHTYHMYIFRYNPVSFNGLTKDQFVAALQAEGITGVMAGYTDPLYKNPVFINKNFMGGEYPMIPAVYPKDIQYADFEERCPVTERACSSEAVWLGMNMLMGNKKDMEDISIAIQKILKYSSQIA